MKYSLILLFAFLVNQGYCIARKPIETFEGPTIEQRIKTDVWPGPGAPPLWTYRYLKMMDEYTDITSQHAFCLRRRIVLNPSPKQGGIIGGIRIGVSSEYPKVGEIFCAQLRISMLFAGNKAPKPGDKVELMYSLTGSDGISVGVLPEIPSRGYLDREEVIITLPLRVTNEDFQLLKLNVCAYVNGDLTDWDWDSVRLNLHTPGYEKLGHIDGREIDDGWKTRLKGKDVAIVDPDGQLIDLGAIGIAAKKP